MLSRMCLRRSGRLAASVVLIGLSVSLARAWQPREDLLRTAGEIGRYGGRIVAAQRAEPKTLNPVTALDNPSREVIQRMMADLIPIDRVSQKPVPGVAKSWKVSRDGREYTLELRRGVRFSDGQPFDADDVVFTFRVNLDEKIPNTQRDLLMVGGRPIEVDKIDPYTVRFRLAQPRAAAERIFDAIAILPRHRLQRAYEEGRFAQTWTLTTPPGEIAGLGPFRLKQYVPGERIVLERNPYYWKEDQKGNRLPYLDELVFVFLANEDMQVMRFLAGGIDVSNRLNARNFSALLKEKRPGIRFEDLGPGLEYNFLFFNLNDPDPKASPDFARRLGWFRKLGFRRAVSAAIDRDAIVRLVYDERATALWSHVTPGNRLWFAPSIPRPPRSESRARALLSEAGFSWKSDGTLIDDAVKPVEFSILTNTGNPERMQIATIVQADLKKIGMKVQIVTLEFRSLLDRVLRTHDYEACVLGLGSGDGDPNSEMNVWLSSGSTHLWHPNQSRPATDWEAEMDRLMRQQLTSLDPAERKRLYDREQQLEAENLPIICLASPNILLAAKKTIGNFRPAVLEHHTLWNAEELFQREPPGAAQ